MGNVYERIGPSSANEPFLTCVGGEWVTLAVVDEDDDTVDFRGAIIAARLHLIRIT